MAGLSAFGCARRMQPHRGLRSALLPHDPAAAEEEPKRPPNGSKGVDWGPVASRAGGGGGVKGARGAQGPGGLFDFDGPDGALRAQVSLPYLDEIDEQQQLQPGTTVCKQGDIGDCMYFIDKGKLDVFVDGLGQVSDLGAGDFFGELALLYEKLGREKPAFDHWRRYLQIEMGDMYW